MTATRHHRHGCAGAGAGIAAAGDEAGAAARTYAFAALDKRAPADIVAGCASPGLAGHAA